MWFRIGINLGDVMVENDDLYGEGVNIAARLQELAEPGGILISGPVYDHGAQQAVGRLRASRPAGGQERDRARHQLSHRAGWRRPPCDGGHSAATGSRRSAHSRTAWRRDCGRVSAHCRGWSAPRWSSSSSCSSSIWPTGRRPLWFHWPAAALGFFVLLWLSLVGHRKRQ